MLELSWNGAIVDQLEDLYWSFRAHRTANYLHQTICQRQQTCVCKWFSHHFHSFLENKQGNRVADLLLRFSVVWKEIKCLRIQKYRHSTLQMFLLCFWCYQQGSTPGCRNDVRCSILTLYRMDGQIKSTRQREFGLEHSTRKRIQSVCGLIAQEHFGFVFSPDPKCSMETLTMRRCLTKKKRFQVAYTCTWKKEEIPGGYSKCMTSTSGTLWRFSTRDVSMSCKFIKCSAFLMGETTRLLPVLKKEVVTFKEMRPVVSKTCHLISLIFTFWHNLSLWVEI